MLEEFRDLASHNPDPMELHVIAKVTLLIRVDVVLGQMSCSQLSTWQLFFTSVWSQDIHISRWKDLFRFFSST